MTETKRRLSASVDAELIEFAEAAVAAGDVPNVSAWVNDAMQMKRAADRRLVALAEAIKDWEKEFGEITEADMAWAEREARRRTVSTRGSRASERRAEYGRPSGRKGRSR